MTDRTPQVSSDEVLLERRGALGQITLHRPKALNALTASMIETIHRQVEAWTSDEEVEVVALTGAGERAFCAGGDVRAARQAHREGAPAADFFTAEYALDAALATSSTPVVAVMDGITMGGGVGLGMNAALRIVTDTTVLAMPETTIGFFPDVGATWRLAQAPGELGTHLALTGASVGGADAIAVGLADRLVDRAEVPALLDQLAEGRSPRAVAETVGEASPPSPLLTERDWIDECYRGDDAAAILARLEAHPAGGARQAAAAIRRVSPLAVVATLAALRQAATLTSLEDVLERDGRLAAAMITTPDFDEGVRAQLVDKDRTPRWQHARVEDVTAADLAALGLA